MTGDPYGNTKAFCRICMFICRYKKHILSFIWVTVILGLILNFFGNWFFSKNIDVTGTPFGKLLSNPLILTILILGLLLLTIIFWSGCTYLEQLSKQYSEQQPVTPEEAKQNRERLLPILQIVYKQQQLPLQRAARISLELKQRFDMTLLPQKLIWHGPDTAERPIAPDTPIASIYEQAGNGLLILGAAGSGKSTLLIDLAQELLQQAQQDPKAPFPVVLNLSSWANTQKPLEHWLAEELLLRNKVPSRLTANWIRTDQLLPFLDGLDEVRDTARAGCIEAINDYHQHHLLSLVVCCRSEVYPFQEHPLTLQSAIEVQPLDSQEVMNYLSAVPSGKTIKTALRQNKVLQELLTTPLMLHIMLLAYQGKSAKDLPQRGSREEQQHYLFESYVNQMLTYRAVPEKLMPSQTLSWLAWLAQQMAKHAQSDFYLERMDFSWLPFKHPWVYRLGIGLLLGLIEGFAFGFAFGLAFGLIKGVISGLVTGLYFGPFGELRLAIYSRKPEETLTWSWKNVMKGLLFGLVTGLLFEVISGLVTGLVSGVVFVIASGLYFGLVFELAGGISLERFDEHALAEPTQGILRSGKNAMLLGLLSGLIFGLPLFGLGGGLLGGMIFGLASGLAFGLVYGGAFYINYYILRLFLSRLECIPWNYVQFLNTAADHILLQKIGGGYRFVHQEFLKYFASLDTSTQTRKARVQATQASSS